jgi:hypothetical protein
MKKQKPKLFIVRKYIRARSVAEAIRKDRTTPVDDVWIDDEWKNGNRKELADAIGFAAARPKDDDEDS